VEIPDVWSLLTQLTISPVVYTCVIRTLEMVAPDITVDWLVPWRAVVPEQRENLGKELQREIGPGQVLYRRPVKAIAHRIDRDDVLFAVETPSQFAVVHLSYAAGEHHPWPTTEIFESISAFVQRRMIPDHRQYAAG
jgi:hypothetical protein